MGEPPFAPAITGPIDDPRHLRPDVAAELFDVKTRERLERMAGVLRYSPAELIREGTLRYLEELETVAPEDEPAGETPDGPESGEQLK